MATQALNGAVLATQSLTKRFGALPAVDGIDFHLPAGARHALIGPNGSGKTTLINLLSGTLRATSGHVILEGTEVTGLSAHRRVGRGLARTFQVNTLFPLLAPLEAVTMAVAQRRGLGLALLRSVKGCREAIDEAYAILEQLHLQSEARRPTRELPYGKQRLLEIALALASRPRVLLLDEPAAGVPQGESSEILAVISELPKEIAVLFIEHDIDLVFRFAEHITVMNSGKILREGKPSEIATDAEVRRVYLGDESYV
jgi:ABC-type branched-subunit amino acid transport system ATPase component